jgi:hypothetical protein
MTDPVNHPPHYTQGDARCSQCGHPIECVDVAETRDFLLGNAQKYLWRCEYKGQFEQDIRKCIWYLERAIEQQKELKMRTSPSGVGPRS